MDVKPTIDMNGLSCTERKTARCQRHNGLREFFLTTATPEGLTLKASMDLITRLTRFQ